MEPKIKRKFRSFSLTLRTTEAASTAIRFDDVAGAAVLLGAGGTAATSLAVWAADSPTSTTFARVYKDGSAIDMTLTQDATTPRVYPVPDEAYAAGAVKLVANNAAATSVSCVIMMKG